MTLFLTLDQVNVTNQNVLIRLDLNIPMEDQKVSDDTRITRILPTLNELINKHAKVIILSHFGRPNGQPNPRLSLAPIAKILESYLNCPVSFAPDCIGDIAKQAIKKTPFGGVVMLENLRFHPEEELNDPIFSKELAKLGDLYINDAFSCSHRAHASVVGIGDYLPIIAGRAMEAELDALQQILTTPARPIMAIVGGSKVSTKLDLLMNLVSKMDYLVLGGGMANTFLLAQGIDIGESLAEPALISQALLILETAKQHNCRVILPQDYRSPDDSFKIMDIGGQTVRMITDHINTCHTVVWNGPVGVFEIPPYDTGSVQIARHIAHRTQTGNLISVAGGGDTLACLNKANVGSQLTYTSTAGGAFLEWLEGKNLAGISALLANKSKS